VDLQEIDYLVEAIGRSTTQFSDSVNIKKLLQIWLEGNQELQRSLIDISKINDVDLASGYQLDVIGNIVGQPRELLSISSSGFFGFLDDLGARSFGSVNNENGGIYYSLYDPDTGNVRLNDLLYRLFIKTKIIQNNAGSTPEEIIQATKFLFQTENVELYEGGTDPDEPAVITLYIGRQWNDTSATFFPGLDETSIADRLLPRPAGVRIEYVNESVREPQDAADNWWYDASLTLYHSAHTVFPKFLYDY